MIRGICKLAALLGASFFFAQCSHAHYYLDFSLDKVRLDRDCLLNVGASNQGEATHFYSPESPSITNFTITQVVVSRPNTVDNNRYPLMLRHPALGAAASAPLSPFLIVDVGRASSLQGLRMRMALWINTREGVKS